MIAPSTPIEETRAALKLTVSLPSHVRTAHDLLHALERKEVDIDAKTAKAIRDSIG
jgi:hypothetical protein